MPRASSQFSTIVRQGDQVVILDQTALPLTVRTLVLSTLSEAAHAIRSMQVRGAPLIGATAAYGLALAMKEDASDEGLQQAVTLLAATRPTAVNLHWALARMHDVLAPLSPTLRTAAAYAEADRICEDDITANRAIGEFGAAALRRKDDNPLQLLTHCNAGALATCGWGTALSPIYRLHEEELAVHVWVSETRPRNQGLLTAWELARNEIPHTLIADNAAGALLRAGKVDAVIVGADRIAANGDTANKIGTYLKALAAHVAGVPFYVAAPWSTVDFSCPDGARIPIEERAASEQLCASGMNAKGEIVCIDLITDTAVWNPAFDVTPAALITGIITETGIHAPSDLARAAENRQA